MSDTFSAAFALFHFYEFLLQKVFFLPFLYIYLHFSVFLFTSPSCRKMHTAVCFHAIKKAAHMRAAFFQ